MRLYAAALLCGVLAAVSSAGAQSAPVQQPATSAANPPPPDTTLRINSKIVLVPTLIEDKNQKVIYALGADNFKLTDNGIPQRVHVDEDLDTTPVSLVVCVQKGRSAAMQFDKFARLGPLLSLFMGNGTGRVSLVEFDSKLEFEEPWSRDTDTLRSDLENLDAGDGGAALLDAAGYSITLLEREPADRRRILLLISESRDHGSKDVSAEELVKKIGTSNTLVLSLTWSPAKAEFLNNLVNPGSGGLSFIQLGIMAVNAMKHNAAKSLAVMSGGEAMSFTGEHGFEDRISEMASHARNRYMLSFRPSDFSPGFHRLQVQLDGNIAGRVVARSNYWATDDTPSSAPATQH